MRLKRLFTGVSLCLLVFLMIPRLSVNAGLLDSIDNATTQTSADSGNSDSDSITGVMKNWGTTNTPDADMTNAGSDFITSKVGVAISVLMYLVMAGLVLTTALDLAYIGLPAVRDFLYSDKSGSSGCQSSGKKKQLISSELRSLLDSNNEDRSKGLSVQSSKKSLVVLYLKKRAVALVVFMVCLILLTSSLFTDFGMNIGNYVLNLFGF